MWLQKPDAEFGKPEAIIDLKHANADWSTKDKSARKNVLEVPELLLYLLGEEGRVIICC